MQYKVLNKLFLVGSQDAGIGRLVACGNPLVFRFVHFKIPNHVYLLILTV